MISATPPARTRRPISSAIWSARHSKISPIFAARSPRGSNSSNSGIGSRCDAEVELVVLADLDHALVPAVGAHHRLVDRQRVEELVGQDDQRAIRHFPQRGMPRDRQVGGVEGLPLQPFQHRVDLDEMHDHRRAEVRHHLGGPQGVEHHGAAAGPELDQADVLGRAHRPPGRRRPQPDQLAEHLADLGRRGEVAAGAERVAGRVIARAWDGSGTATCIARRASDRPSRCGGESPLRARVCRRASGAPCRLVSHRPSHKGDARQHQWQRQQHAHRQPAPQEAELRVGLAE